ncbi:hypothetical protein B296_00051120 [Ensete ventricosum]|uniref:RING-type E3 ubiquitin transferase n=1 Tax=Ensete ventricosum TaxID=4639 RepID=A0A426YEN6_ENSVE|nr:hypothetical protein B296_00051120 [Ensete ventricosum]
METAPSYWCYRCGRFVRLWPRAAVVCPDCGGGFLEEEDGPSRAPPLYAAVPQPQRRRFPSPATDSATFEPPHQPSELRVRRSRRAPTGNRSPFNPVIVLRSPPDVRGDADGATIDNFELYYDDGAGSGLRPLPESMSDFLMDSGFERLLDQLAHIEINGTVGSRVLAHLPASKAAIESMPTIEINDGHIIMESHCAVCKEPFVFGTEACEMPCKHIYHQDCILPWLSLRNSCPVCRHEMPMDVPEEDDNGEEMVGLTIWRLPGGGFAVGRYTGGRIAEGDLPVVYTEMDGELNSRMVPRRMSSPLRGSQSREDGGINHNTFGSVFSFFRHLRSPSSSSRLSSEPLPTYASLLTRRRSLRRRNTNWGLEAGNANTIARS